MCLQNMVLSHLDGGMLTRLTGVFVWLGKNHNYFIDFFFPLRFGTKIFLFSAFFE